MMNINYVSKKIEIAFWNTSTSLLTDSQFIRKIIRDTYQAINRPVSNVVLFILLLSAATGLSLGLVIGLAGISLW